MLDPLMSPHHLLKPGWVHPMPRGAVVPEWFRPTPVPEDNLSTAADEAGAPKYCLAIFETVGNVDSRAAHHCNMSQSIGSSGNCKYDVNSANGVIAVGSFLAPSIEPKLTTRRGPAAGWALVGSTSSATAVVARPIKLNALVPLPVARARVLLLLCN